MKINQIVHLSEGVAGPKNCWPGYKKTGTQPGTGKNKGKRVNDCEKIKQQGVAEAAKWRTQPDAHDLDTDGSYIPKGGIKSDNLAIRQKASKTQSEKDPKSMAGMFGAKYAKKHGVPTKQLMKNIPLDDKEQGVSEGAKPANPSKNYQRLGGNGAHVTWLVTFRDGTTKKVWADSREHVSQRLSPEDNIRGFKATKIDEQGVAEAGNANSGRRGPDYQDNSPVVPGRVEHLPQGLRHHADASRYGGTEPDDKDDRLLGPQQRHRLHRAVTPDDLDEQEKIAGRHDPDDFDDMIGRLKKLAGAGPLTTVWDPAKRVYKNVPHAVQPAQQPKKAPQ